MTSCLSGTVRGSDIGLVIRVVRMAEAGLGVK